MNKKTNDLIVKFKAIRIIECAFKKNKLIIGQSKFWPTQKSVKIEGSVINHREGCRRLLYDDGFEHIIPESLIITFKKDNENRCSRGWVYFFWPHRTITISNYGKDLTIITSTEKNPKDGMYELIVFN